MQSAGSSDIFACLHAGALEEDALLEAVVLLGALAGQPDFDEPLAGCGLVSHVSPRMRTMQCCCSCRFLKKLLACGSNHHLRWYEPPQMNTFGVDRMVLGCTYDRYITALTVARL
jgi:hypothetical protein